MQLDTSQCVAQQNDPCQRKRSESPMHFSITLDRDPAHTSSRKDLRSDTAPPNFEAGRRIPQFTAEGCMSPSLNVPNGSPPPRQVPLDSRHDSSPSSLGQIIELLVGSDVAWAQGRRAHDIESRTDTEAEPEEDIHLQNAAVWEGLPL